MANLFFFFGLFIWVITISAPFCDSSSTFQPKLQWICIPSGIILTIKTAEPFNGTANAVGHRSNCTGEGHGQTNTHMVIDFDFDGDYCGVKYENQTGTYWVEVEVHESQVPVFEHYAVFNVTCDNSTIAYDPKCYKIDFCFYVFEQCCSFDETHWLYIIIVAEWVIIFGLILLNLLQCYRQFKAGKVGDSNSEGDYFIFDKTGDHGTKGSDTDDSIREIVEPNNSIVKKENIPVKKSQAYLKSEIKAVEALIALLSDEKRKTSFKQDAMNALMKNIKLDLQKRKSGFKPLNVSFSKTAEPTRFHREASMK